MVQNERWVAVVGFEGFYEVSDRGRVRSLPRERRRVDYELTPKGFVKQWQTMPPLRSSRPRVLQPKHRPRTRGGYPEVCLRAPGKKQRSACLHRLVLEAFVGPPPTSRHQGAHLNGQPSDNRLTNLAWVLASTNADHKKQHGRTTGPLIALKTRAINALRDAGFAFDEIAACLGLVRSTVERRAAQ